MSTHIYPINPFLLGCTIINMFNLHLIICIYLYYLHQNLRVAIRTCTCPHCALTFAFVFTCVCVYLSVFSYTSVFLYFLFSEANQLLTESTSVYTCVHLYLLASICAHLYCKVHLCVFAYNFGTFTALPHLPSSSVVIFHPTPSLSHLLNDVINANMVNIIMQNYC